MAVRIYPDTHTTSSFQQLYALIFSQINCKQDDRCSSEEDSLTEEEDSLTLRKMDSLAEEEGSLALRKTDSLAEEDSLTEEEDSPILRKMLAGEKVKMSRLIWTKEEEASLTEAVSIA